MYHTEITSAQLKELTKHLPPAFFGTLPETEGNVRIIIDAVREEDCPKSRTSVDNSISAALKALVQFHASMTSDVVTGIVHMYLQSGKIMEYPGPDGESFTGVEVDSTVVRDGWFPLEESDETYAAMILGLGKLMAESNEAAAYLRYSKSEEELDDSANPSD